MPSLYALFFLRVEYPIFSVKSCKLLSCWACVIAPCSWKVFRVATCRSYSSRRFCSGVMVSPCCIVYRVHRATVLPAVAIVSCRRAGFKSRFNVRANSAQSRLSNLCSRASSIISVLQATKSFRPALRNSYGWFVGEW